LDILLLGASYLYLMICSLWYLMTVFFSSNCCKNYLLTSESFKFNISVVSLSIPSATSKNVTWRESLNFS